MIYFFLHIQKNYSKKKNRKFSTMDILVPISMKNAAKCDKQCELQNSTSHRIFECKWRWTRPACLVQCARTSHNLMRLNFNKKKYFYIFFFFELLPLNKVQRYTCRGLIQQKRPGERSSHISSLKKKDRDLVQLPPP